jgi:predicted nicotinamide N-methyase
MSKRQKLSTEVQEQQEEVVTNTTTPTPTPTTTTTTTTTIHTSRTLEYIDTATKETLHTVSVNETLIDTTVTNSTGLHLWPSSVLLGAKLVDLGQRGMLNGLHVVELGAGTGVAGRIAGSFGASSVVFTDNDSMVLQSLAKMVNKMNSNDTTTAKYNVVQLDWGNLNHLTRWLTPSDEPGVDLILGADCMYDRDHWDKFLATVYFLLSSSFNGGSSKYNGGGNGIGGSVSKKIKPRFIGCHQLRNSNHTIQPLLKKWGLVAKELLPSSIVSANNFEFKETLGLFELTIMGRE